MSTTTVYDQFYGNDHITTIVKVISKTLAIKNMTLYPILKYNFTFFLKKSVDESFCFFQQQLLMINAHNHCTL